jgi:hypothetical protein
VLRIPRELLRSYNEILGRKTVEQNRRPHYLRWLRFYLDFCAKYRCSPRSGSSIPRLVAKLEQKNQEEWKRKQTEAALGLCLELVGAEGSEHDEPIRHNDEETREPRAARRGTECDQYPANAQRGGRVPHRAMSVGARRPRARPRSTDRSDSAHPQDSRSLRPTQTDRKPADERVPAAPETSQAPVRADDRRRDGFPDRSGGGEERLCLQSEPGLQYLAVLAPARSGIRISASSKGWCGPKSARASRSSCRVKKSSS